MNARLCWALVFSFSAAAAGPDACRPCHPTIVDSWQRTGMGRSVQSPAAMPEGIYYHRVSNRHYAVRQGAVRRHQIAASGKEVNVERKPVDLLIGSGNHAITPVHRAPGGKLVQMPVTWYRQESGWAMSPGYDRPDHLGFRRPITAECLFCHAAYPHGEDLPRAIDCERCHGPSASHLRTPKRGTILNPSALPPDRQLDICLQCHLETASRGFPDSMRKQGRDVNSFQPGQRLADYKAYFDRADGADRFEINHAGFGLLRSACFNKSAGKLGCTTCHDPHSARTLDVCASCHSALPPSHAVNRNDCAGCHMPKRTAEDAIHTRMTDHRIGIHADLPVVTRENHTPYRGDIVPFRGWSGADSLAAARALHQAQSLGTPAAWRKTLPTPANLAALGDALMRAGSQREGRRILMQVLESQPGHVTALNGLAVYEGVRNNLKQAMRLLERAREADPNHTLTWINLGVAYENIGDSRQALACYDEAVRLQPDSQEARRRRQALLDATP